MSTVNYQHVQQAVLADKITIGLSKETAFLFLIYQGSDSEWGEIQRFPLALQFPDPRIARNNIIDGSTVIVGEGENANLSLAEGFIMHRINDLIVHINGNEVAVGHDRDKVRLIQPLVDH